MDDVDRCTLQDEKLATVQTAEAEKEVAENEEKTEEETTVAYRYCMATASAHEFLQPTCVLVLAPPSEVSLRPLDVGKSFGLGVIEEVEEEMDFEDDDERWEYNMRERCKQIMQLRVGCTWSVSASNITVHGAVNENEGILVVVPGHPEFLSCDLLQIGNLLKLREKLQKVYERYTDIHGLHALTVPTRAMFSRSRYGPFASGGLSWRSSTGLLWFAFEKRNTR